MRKTTLFLLAAVVLGGWYVNRNFELRRVDGGMQVVARTASGGASRREAHWPTVQRTGDTLRIASFNVQALGETKLEKPQVAELLARIVRRFDIVALQGIVSRNQDVLPTFVDQINAAGGQYDYVISQRLGRGDQRQQYAFVFDRASVELDRSRAYTVQDPEDLLLREPFVAWFRVRGPAPEEAFTFSLASVHVDPQEASRELNVLDDVYRVVLDDGRNEDDVILLGDFQASSRDLGDLGRVPGMMAVVHSATDTRQTRALDNIVLQQRATTEFTGRGGVFSFLREWNLTLEEAMEISEHCPVWAEFTLHEGGVPGHVADGRRSAPASRKR